MKYLFVHQNMPGQYLHIVRHLCQQAGNQVVFITQPNPNEIAGVAKLVYQPFRPAHPSTHHYLRDAEQAVIAGQSVHALATHLKVSGFRPDIIIGHAGWGETLYLKDVWSDVPLLAYFEFFYHMAGADMGFDPAVLPPGPDDPPRVRTKNATALLALQACDWGQTPTRWQWSLHPPHARAMISVLHEGVDTGIVIPDPAAWLALPGTGRRLTAGHQVITFVARNLEPYRGFHVFMRALPMILARHPQAEVLIVGGDEVSYGPPDPSGKPFRLLLLEELGRRIDPDRVHFLGKVSYDVFLRILQISTAHIYLTYPFVLSWSFLEAMAAGCLIIGSATAPVLEVMRDRENGLLVDFFDQAAIADRVEEALTERERLGPIRVAARQTIIDHYDLNRIALPQYTTLINEVVNGRRPA